MRLSTSVLSVIALSFVLLVASGLLALRESSAIGEKHGQVACANCHQLFASVNVSPAGFNPNRQCLNCHKSHARGTTESPLNFHASAGEDCISCHSFHNPREITAAGRTFTYDFSSTRQQAQCFSCHGSNQDLSRLSSGHRKAAGVFHSDSKITAVLSPSEACLVCHSSSNTGLSGEAAKYSPRFEEHGSHPVGFQVRAGSGKPGNRIRSHIDERIPLFDGRIECQSCHSLSASNRYRLIPFEDQSDLCRGCHATR